MHRTYWNSRHRSGLSKYAVTGILALVVTTLVEGTSVGQPTEVPQPVRPSCPPDVSTNSAPTVGSAVPNLSDKLSESKGIICPPAGIDPEIAIRPPPTGNTKIIPPPGTPGGDPTVEPK